MATSASSLRRAREGLAQGRARRKLEALVAMTQAFASAGVPGATEAPR